MQHSPLYVYQEEDYLQTVCEWRDAVTVTAKVTYLHQLAETIVTTDSEEAGLRAFGKGNNALLSFEPKPVLKYKRRSEKS